MGYFIIMRGPLGSGKTTIAQKLKSRLDAEYISIDLILKNHGLDKVSPKAECIPLENFIKANEIILSAVLEKLKRGKIMIFDACFYHKKALEDLVRKLPFPHYVFTLKAPLNICIERDKKRNKTLGKEAVTAVYKLVSRFDYGMVIDASRGTSDKVVKEIVLHLPKSTTVYAKKKNPMEISKGIEIVDTALWLQKEKILIINDLHLGYEEALHRKGVLVPKFQLEEIIKIMKSILIKVKPKKIVINGDLKHEFGTVLRQEWKEVLQFLDFCIKNCEEVILIKGNHDPLLRFIAEKRGVTVVKEYKIKDIIVIHGDELLKTDAPKIIIGHEHPAITIREGSKWEKYKCFLKGKWKGKELIAIPSFNPLLEGTDILKEELLSPFLENIRNFEVYIISKGEVFGFGKVKNFF